MDPATVTVDVGAWVRLTAAVALAHFVVTVVAIVWAWLSSRRRRRRQTGRPA